jgi:hypothetical protein
MRRLKQIQVFKQAKHVNYVKFLTHFYTQKLTHPHAKKSPIKMVGIY